MGASLILIHSYTSLCIHVRVYADSTAVCKHVPLQVTLTRREDPTGRELVWLSQLPSSNGTGDPPMERGRVASLVSKLSPSVQRLSELVLAAVALADEEESALRFFFFPTRFFFWNASSCRCYVWSVCVCSV